MRSLHRNASFEFQLEDFDQANALTLDAKRLYAAGAAGDTALCWLSSQLAYTKVRQLSVPILRFAPRHWDRQLKSKDIIDKARSGLPLDALRDAVPVKLSVYSVQYPDALPVFMAGLLRIGGLLQYDGNGRDPAAWYEFSDEDLPDARRMTPDADLLYAAGRAGDKALEFMAIQQDIATFGKSFSVPWIDLCGDPENLRPDSASDIFMQKARRGLPTDALRNVIAVEVILYAGERNTPSIHMAGVLYIGGLLDHGGQ
ncbi:MAG: hypothetical protein V4805_17640 [Pseudomonadota bacterium]